MLIRVYWYTCFRRCDKQILIRHYSISEQIVSLCENKNRFYLFYSVLRHRDPKDIQIQKCLVGIKE